jgi:signal transduction histidine kinase
LPTGLQLADAAVGVCLLASSGVAARRRPESRVGVLLGVAGATWFAGNVWSGALYVHRGALVFLLLAYPTGRLRGWPSRLAVAAAYGTAVVDPWARNDHVTIAVAALVAITAASVFVPSIGPDRRALVPALVAALAYAGILGSAAYSRLAAWDAQEGVTYAYDAVVAIVVLGLLAALLRGRWAEGVVTDLVVDLGERAGTTGLSGALSRALGDRTLVVGYWDRSEQRYADEHGNVVVTDHVPPGRSVAPIADGGEPLAVLIHDDAVLADPAHVEAIAAAARFAVSSARLRTEAYERIGQLEASRRRIVTVADLQRQRVAKDLHDGAEADLGRVAELVADAHALAAGVDESLRGHLDVLGSELNLARAELEESAQGIHPRALVDGGLDAALPALAALSGSPATLEVDVGRLPPAIEAAVYFIAAEAMTNATKHAGARHLRVAVRAEDGAVSVVVTDDGCGGADPANGSGLRGLTDRVEALGGSLSVLSPPGHGTTVRASFPVDGSSTSPQIAGLRDVP